MTISQSRIEAVMNFIEQHLDEALNVKTLSELACYSEFHFQRLFRAQVGESVHAFRKRLLLERAMRHVCLRDSPITEIAFQAGYETVAAFNKAFKQEFDTSPTQARQQFHQKTFQQFSWRNTMSLTPTEPFDNKIIKQLSVEVESREPIQVICARGNGDYASAAADAWGKVMPFAYGNRLMNAQVASYGISHDDPNVTESEAIRYDACLQLDLSQWTQPLPEGLRQETIARGTYVKALHKGPYETLSETYNTMFRLWLPQSGYELRDAPCFERYLNRDPSRTKPENLRTEVWIPLQ